ncbi:MAG: lysophospholipid acyltransferase family protein [bacterium]
MKLGKRILFFLATRFGHLLARLVCRLARVEIVNAAPVQDLESRGAPVLYALWHGRMLVPVWWHRGTRSIAMVSRHEDGEMVSQLIARMGYKTVRGSSTRGGGSAARQMVAALRKGAVAAMICDGPRGPAMKMKIGTPWIAAMGGAWVVPITWAGNRVWRFRSWDSFQVPKPFSRAVVLLGDPLAPVEKETSAIEQFRVLFERRMNELVQKAEELAKAPTR